MKKLQNILLIGGMLIFLLSNTHAADVNTIARQASVQTVFHLPVLKVYFTDEWEPDKPEFVKVDQLKEIIDQKIKIAQEKQKELKSKETHNGYTTRLEKYGVEPASATIIALQALIPPGTKLPTRVIKAVKVEKEEITPWDKEYEDDVLSISETANVSPSKAKEILRKLRTDGFSISKDSVVDEQEITLLHFDEEWDRADELDWKVRVEGKTTNIICDYDPYNKLLITKPIPKEDGDLKRVYVRAGYYDLKELPKPEEVKELEADIEDLKDTIEELEEEIEKLTEEEEEKRDIRDVTWFDVQMGRVALEQYWVVSAASGVFLGNMKCRKEFNGYGNSRLHTLQGEDMGIILTNAHVANMALNFEVYVTEDKETMWIVYPGIPFVRYTQESDYYGSPAKLLMYDRFPVSSWGCDTAIMVTTAVPGYEKFKAVLGNSDNVKEGDRVVMVGNPSYLQKYSFQGVITNKNYNILNSFMGERILKKGLSKEMFDWAKNSSMWFDCEGSGGTSGSGVWALTGPERGKVIALHNMGVVQPTAISVPADKAGHKLNPNTIWGISPNIPLRDALKGQQDTLFENYSYRDASYKYTYDEFIKGEEGFDEAMRESHGYMDMPGMNAGIEINTVKRYLNERGIDPHDFGWGRQTGKYWKK